MKRHSMLAVTILALLLSLVVIVPAGAVDYPDAGFDIDCEKAVGYGWVPPHESVWWDIHLWDPASWDPMVTGSGWILLTGSVSGGETGKLFSPEVIWPIEITQENEYKVYIKNCLVASGHFDCEPEPPCGMGCTPGYWKQPQHLDSWGPTGFSPGDDFDTKFGGDYFSPDISLLDALKLKGGGFNALARHAVAGLLNASHPDVEYGLTTEEVIALLDGGTEANKDILEYYNELGCPLD